MNNVTPRSVPTKHEIAFIAQYCATLLDGRKVDDMCIVYAENSDKAIEKAYQEIKKKYECKDILLKRMVS